MRFAALASSLFLGLVACGTNAGDDDDAVDCSTVTDADTFTVGLEKPGVGGMLDFKLMSIDPSIPTRSFNTWVLQIDSMSSGVVGSPVDGANLVVSPFMPAHQHGPGVDPIVTATGNPGEYKIEKINLWMPGVWETTMQVSTPNADRAVYRFCIN